MWTPLPACSGSSSGTKLARMPVAPGDLAHDLPEARPLRSAAARPAAAATGISNWCGAYSGKKRSGSTPASRSAAITRVANGSARRCASSEKGSAARLRRRSSWNSCSKLARSTHSELAARARRSARAGSCRGQHAHGASVDLDDVAQQQLQRPSPRRRRHTRTRVSGSGSRRRSPVEPNGLGSATGPSGVSAWLAGTQPTPALEVLGELGGEHRSARARSPRGRSTPARRAPPSLTSASPAAAVPLSQMPSARPEPRRRRRGRRARPRASTTAIIAAGRHVAPLERRGQPLPRLHVHAAAAERRVGVGDARTGLPPGPRTRPTTQAKCPTSQSGAGPSSSPSKR